MILKNITLENIRSYEDKTVIDFPYGRTLFQGDMGSGKSTIFSGVEFALFGLGDIDANHFSLRPQRVLCPGSLKATIRVTKYTGHFHAPGQDNSE